MSERRFRKPNALKHGGFSNVELLPWEDADEFAQLRRDLFEEHQPEGPLQEECVNTIQTNLWRKRRLRAKRNFDLAAALDKAENRVLWEEPLPLFHTEDELIVNSLEATLDGPRRTGPRWIGPQEDEQLLGFSSRIASWI